MIFVKSVLAGLVSLTLAAILLPSSLLIAFMLLHPPQSGTTASIDVVSVARHLHAWIIGVLAFALGFGWEYRRVRERKSR